MSVYEYYIVLNAMKSKADKFDLRLKMVRCAIAEGINRCADGRGSGNTIGLFTHILDMNRSHF